MKTILSILYANFWMAGTAGLVIAEQRGAINFPAALLLFICWLGTGIVAMDLIEKHYKET